MAEEAVCLNDWLDELMRSKTCAGIRCSGAVVLCEGEMGPGRFRPGMSLEDALRVCEQGAAHYRSVLEQIKAYEGK